MGREWTRTVAVRFVRLFHYSSRIFYSLFTHHTWRELSCNFEINNFPPETKTFQTEKISITTQLWSFIPFSYLNIHRNSGLNMPVHFTLNFIQLPVSKGTLHFIKFHSQNCNFACHRYFHFFSSSIYTAQPIHCPIPQQRFAYVTPDKKRISSNIRSPLPKW